MPGVDANLEKFGYINIYLPYRGILETGVFTRISIFVDPGFENCARQIERDRRRGLERMFIQLEGYGWNSEVQNGNILLK